MYAGLMSNPGDLDASPKAARVHGNDWRELDPPDLRAWEPTVSLTVVMPYYESPDELDLTLAGLNAQTYPSDLIEVVIADDGSQNEPVAPDWVDHTTRVVRQERNGFGLARARNLGALSASGDILVFLDCDMVPEPEFLAAHARWHHLVSDAVVVGMRRHVDFSGISPGDVEDAGASGGLSRLFAGREVTRPEWLYRHYERTRMGTSGDDDLFRMMSGGNISVPKWLFLETGGVDPSFNQWGGEDNEFGFRLYTNGALVIPEPDALAWHQGAGEQPDPEEQESARLQQAKMINLIADYTYRPTRSGRSYTVPYVVVTIGVGDTSGEEVKVTVEGVLASRWHDLVVAVACPADYSDLEWLRRQFQGDDRVVVGVGVDIDELWPASPIRMRVPSGTRLSTGSIESMLSQLGGKGVGTLRVTVPYSEPPGAHVLARTTRSWRRALRLAGSAEEADVIAGELFGERWDTGLEHGIAPAETSRGSAIRAPAPLLQGERLNKAIDDASSELAERIVGLENTIGSLRNRRVLRLTDAAGGAVRSGLRGDVSRAARVWRSKLSRDAEEPADSDYVRFQVRELLRKNFDAD